MSPDLSAGIAHQDTGTGGPGRKTRLLKSQSGADQIPQPAIMLPVIQFIQNGARRGFRKREGGFRRGGPDGDRSTGSRTQQSFSDAPVVRMRQREVIQHAGPGQQQRRTGLIGKRGHVGTDKAVLEEIRRTDPHVVGMTNVDRQRNPRVHRLDKSPPHGVL